MKIKKSTTGLNEVTVKLTVGKLVSIQNALRQLGEGKDTKYLLYR